MMQPTSEMRDLLFRYDQQAPLEAEVLAVDKDGDLVRERIVFTSVNLARVPALLVYDATVSAPRPTLMLQHWLNSSKDDPRLGDLSASWAKHGFACFTIDSPLHGERANGDFDVLKLLELPYSGMRFVAQNVIDLRRAVDYIETRADLDAGRIAYAGFSMSAVLGPSFVATEPRVRAASLALGGAGLFHFLAARVPPERRDDQTFVANLVDPLHYAGQIAPRPVLQVNSETDEVIPAALGHMLYSALNDPKRAIWFQGVHGEIPDDVLREIRQFLEEALG